MNEDALKELANAFAREVETSEDLQAHRADHQRRSQRAQAMLTVERIPSLMEADLREMFLDSDAFNFWTNKEWEFNDRLQSLGLEGLRRALLELVTRAERGLTAEDLKHVWSMRGIGKVLSAELLAYRFPSRYWPYSQNVTLPAFKTLGDDIKANMPRGQRSDAYLYLALGAGMARVRQALSDAGLPAVDNLLADIFVWWVKQRGTPPKPSFWLFQANPDQYDLAKALQRTKVGHTDSWAVSRYRDEMHKGDPVLLWQAGAQSGVYAIGELIVEPYERDQESSSTDMEATPYLRNKWWVDFRYTQIANKPIFRDTLKEHPVLRNLLVIRNPQGTNFRVTAEEWAALQDLLQDSKARFDRASEASARHIIESLLPDAALRRACLAVLADSIDEAHKIGPSCWGLTLFPDGFRLNVGRVEVMSIERGEISLILDGKSLTMERRRELSASDDRSRRTKFVTVPGSFGCDFPPERLSAILPVARESYFTLVRNAANTVRERTPFFRSHSPGVIAYMRSELGKNVPQPDYTAEPPTVDVRAAVARSVAASGLHFTEWQIATFFTALQTKGFVILSGISGTGKSKLAQHFAELLSQRTGAPDGEERNWLFVPVRPDWRDGKSLLGYFNPLTATYEWTPFLRFLLGASGSYRANDGAVWLLILDEMNLAHVEYYFADLLSVLESGRNQDGWTREPLRPCYPDDARGDLPPREMPIPPNFYVVGTVNVDETTHAFSPKVLDRAFTLELTEADFTAYPPRGNEESVGSDLGDAPAVLDAFTQQGQFAVPSKLRIAEYVTEHPEVRTQLQTLNDLLRPFGLHFGYRVFDEIVSFLDAADRNGLFEGIGGLGAAFDAAVLMKVLPKFHGSRGKLEGPIRAVLAWCVDPETPREETIEDALQQVESGDQACEALSQLICRYPATAERARRMLRLLYVDGFAAFG